MRYLAALLVSYVSCTAAQQNCNLDSLCTIPEGCAIASCCYYRARVSCAVSLGCYSQSLQSECRTAAIGCSDLSCFLPLNTTGCSTFSGKGVVTGLALSPVLPIPRLTMCSTLGYSACVVLSLPTAQRDDFAVVSAEGQYAITVFDQSLGAPTSCAGPFATSETRVSFPATGSVVYISSAIPATGVQIRVETTEAVSRSISANSSTWANANCVAWPSVADTLRLFVSVSSNVYISPSLSGVIKSECGIFSPESSGRWRVYTDCSSAYVARNGALSRAIVTGDVVGFDAGMSYRITAEYRRSVYGVNCTLLMRNIGDTSLPICTDCVKKSNCFVNYTQPICSPVRSATSIIVTLTFDIPRETLQFPFDTNSPPFLVSVGVPIGFSATITSARSVGSVVVPRTVVTTLTDLTIGFASSVGVAVLDFTLKKLCDQPFNTTSIVTCPSTCTLSGLSVIPGECSPEMCASSTGCACITISPSNNRILQVSSGMCLQYVSTGSLYIIVESSGGYRINGGVLRNILVSTPTFSFISDITSYNITTSQTTLIRFSFLHPRLSCGLFTSTPCLSFATSTSWIPLVTGAPIYCNTPQRVESQCGARDAFKPLSCTQVSTGSIMDFRNAIPNAMCGSSSGVVACAYTRSTVLGSCVQIESPGVVVFIAEPRGIAVASATPTLSSTVTASASNTRSSQVCDCVKVACTIVDCNDEQCMYTTNAALEGKACRLDRDQTGVCKEGICKDGCSDIRTACGPPVPCRFWTCRSVTGVAQCTSALYVNGEDCITGGQHGRCQSDGTCRPPCTGVACSSTTCSQIECIDGFCIQTGGYQLQDRIECDDTEAPSLCSFDLGGCVPTSLIPSLLSLNFNPDTSPLTTDTPDVYIDGGLIYVPSGTTSVRLYAEGLDSVRASLAALLVDGLTNWEWDAGEGRLVLTIAPQVRTISTVVSVVSQNHHIFDTVVVINFVALPHSRGAATFLLGKSLQYGNTITVIAPVFDSEVAIVAYSLVAINGAGDAYVIDDIPTPGQPHVVELAFFDSYTNISLAVVATDEMDQVGSCDRCTISDLEYNGPIEPLEQALQSSTNSDVIPISRVTSVVRALQFHTTLKLSGDQCTHLLNSVISVIGNLSYSEVVNDVLQGMVSNSERSLPTSSSGGMLEAGATLLGAASLGHASLLSASGSLFNLAVSVLSRSTSLSNHFALAQSGTLNIYKGAIAAAQRVINNHLNVDAKLAVPGKPLYIVQQCTSICIVRGPMLGNVSACGVKVSFASPMTVQRALAVIYFSGKCEYESRLYSYAIGGTTSIVQLYGQTASKWIELKKSTQALQLQDSISVPFSGFNDTVSCASLSGTSVTALQTDRISGICTVNSFSSTTRITLVTPGAFTSAGTPLPLYIQAPPSSDRGKALAIGLGVGVGLALPLLIFLVLGLVLYRRTSKKPTTGSPKEFTKYDTPGAPFQYSQHTIETPPQPNDLRLVESQHGYTAFPNTPNNYQAPFF